jgi:MFS family permease
VLADTIPIYPLYPLLFADAGLSNARISTLFLLWSAVGIVAGVPCGALADRFSRRAALVVAGVSQAAGYVLWISAPGYLAFAAGFVLWGLGGAFGSGALEALVYDAMASVGGEGHYPRVYSRVKAVGLLSQLPAAAAATVLFATGGYVLVGWVSVASCLAAAAFATRLPEVRPDPIPVTSSAPVTGSVPVTSDVPGRPDADGDQSGYLAMLRAGVAEAALRPAVRAAVVAVAVLGGLDGVEEYFPLLAQHWGVATPMVPLVVVAIPLVGGAGAALGGAARALAPRSLAVAFGAAVVVFIGAELLQQPAGVAGIALAYGLYQLVLVVVDTRLQQRITGPARATVASVAALGTDVTAIALYGVWALGRPGLVAVAALALAAGLPWLLEQKEQKERKEQGGR